MKAKLFIASIFICSIGNAQTIAGGGQHSLVIRSDKTVKAYGYNLYGQLGNGTNTDSNLPIPLSSLTAVKAIAGGHHHSLALKNDGTVWTWGYNLYGQLGNGTSGLGTESNIPVLVNSLMNITAIAGGSDHSLVLKSDGTVWAWGNNSYGQLGNGTNGPGTDSNVPVPVSSLTGIIAIAGGGEHSVALKNDGTVWTWGHNAFGGLGNGTNGPGTDSNVPVQVSSLSGITAVAAGGYHSFALKNDSTVWAWGYNLYGELGNGNNTNSNTPVPVSSFTSVIGIAGGYDHSLALKNDGTVWAWGYNLYGRLGNGNNTDSNVPVQVNSLSGITAIAGGHAHSLFLKDDCTVWTCGYNGYGELGNGNNISSNVPLKVTELFVVGLSEDASVCSGNSVILTASGALNYTWSPTTGLNVMTGNSVSASPISTTTYTVIGSDGMCSSSDVINVLVNSSFTITASSNISICSGNSATLTADGAIAYSWSPTTGLNTTTGNSVSADPLSTIIYTVTATNIDGCSDASTISIVVTENPIINVSSNISVCLGNPVGLTVVGIGVSEYHWQPFNTLSSNTGSDVIATPTVTTTYTVTGYDSYGCSKSESTTVIINPCTSINENIINQSLVIFPNPTNDYINISFTLQDNALVAVSLVDIQGKVIFKESKSQLRGRYNTTIGLLDQAKGIYFLQIVTNTGIVTRKIALN